MSGRRRRSLLATLLRGGALGRRLRVKAILLSGARRRGEDFQHWVAAENLRGFIPIALASVVMHLLGAPLPVTTAVLTGAMAWVGFVLAQTGVAAFRVNRRHQVWLEAAGLDLSLRSVLQDKALWRTSAGGMTLRELIIARKTRGGGEDVPYGATSKASSSVR